MAERVVLAFLLGAVTLLDLPPSTTLADEVCKVGSAASCTPPNPCFNGRGVTGGVPWPQCAGTSTGPCSRDRNDSTGYVVTEQTPYFSIPVVFHLIKSTTGQGGLTSLPPSKINGQILELVS